MGKLMKKYLLILLIGLGVVQLTHAAATKFTDLQTTGDITVGDDLTVNDDVNITGTVTAGDLAVTGTSTIAGGMTFSKTATFSKGITASTATFTAGSVIVSTATGSTSSLCLVGSIAALPTGTYGKGCILYLTSDNKVYVSTETVAGAWSWQAVGAQ